MPTPVPLDNLLGAALIGILISTVIYGINCLQVYMYYSHHAAYDNRILKSFVALVATLDTVHLMILVSAYYHYGVAEFGNFASLEHVTWSLWIQVAVGGCISVCVQSFFGLRLYHLSGRRIYIPIMITFLGLAQLGCLLVYIVDGFKFSSFGHLPPTAPTLAALATAIVDDIAIAIGMFYHLRKKRTQSQRTNKGLNLLINYAVNTCALTTLFAAACMITWLKKPATLLYALFYFILVRLHSCSLMSTLNSREQIRQALGGLHMQHDFINLGVVATPAAPACTAVATNGLPTYTKYAHESVGLEMMQLRKDMRETPEPPEPLAV